MKKWFFILLVILGGALFLMFGKQEKKSVLYLYNWSDYMGKEALEKFEQQFQCRVKQDFYSSNEELLAKLQAGATGYDVIVPSDYMMRTLIRLDLLEPLDHSKIPNRKNLETKFQNPPFDFWNTYSIPYTWGTTGLAVNTKYIPNPSATWGMLFDEKYKGRICMVSDLRETMGAALKYLGYSVNTRSPRELEEVKTLLMKQRKWVKSFTGDPKLLLSSEESWLGLEYNGDALQVQSQIPTLTYLYPKEGGIIWVDNFAIPKGASHKELAMQFINFIQEPTINASIMNEIRYATSNRKAKAYVTPSDLQNPSIYPTEDQIKNYEYLEDLGEATKLWDRVWTEVVSQ